MKKIMVAAFAVALAAVAQAATVTWGSGALYTAANAQGGWSTTTAMSAEALVTMNVYVVDKATFDIVSAKDMAGIYDWAKEQADATHTAKNYTTKYIGAATATAANVYEASKTYYSIITAEYTDAQYGDMYMATTKEFTTLASGAATNSNLLGGQTSPVGGWAAAAVPEPTSGLLLLLGMAGLALKRKVA